MIEQIEVDDTPFGRWGDHCPYCGHDWKQPHDRDCERFRQCQYPPGCDHDSAPGRNACRPHLILVGGLFGEPVTDEQIAWANAEIAKRGN